MIETTDYMESLLVTTRSGDFSFNDAANVMTGDGKVCPSPISTFGSNFNDKLFLQASNALRDNQLLSESTCVRYRRETSCDRPDQSGK